MSVIIKNVLRPTIKIIEPSIEVLHPGSLIYFQFMLQKSPLSGWYMQLLAITQGDGVKGMRKGKECEQ